MKILTLLHCMYLFFINWKFRDNNYTEFNVSYSQQTTSIFLVGIGIQDLIFDMLQSGGRFKRNFFTELCTTNTLHHRELFLLINKVTVSGADPEFFQRGC